MSPEEMKGWKHHPVTEVYIKSLEEARQEIMESWAAGLYTTETTEGTAQKNAEALGAINQLNEILFNIEEMGEIDES